MVTNAVDGHTYDSASDTWRPLTAAERRELARVVPEYRGRGSAAPIIHGAAHEQDGVREKNLPQSASLASNAAAALAEETLTRWHESSEVRRKFRDLSTFHAFRRGEAEDRSVFADARKPVEQRAKLVWERRGDVRDEFEKMGGFESYVAWRRRAECTR